VRQEGARRTRQAIITAAAELFVTHGYAATSLTDVAQAAGVARPTVIAAFGSKPALLKQVLDHALAGDDEPVPVRDRPWFQPVWNAPTQAGVLDAYAAVCLLIADRAGPIFEAVRRAADATPEVSEVWDTLLSNRRRGARMVIDHVRSLGPLHPGLDLEQATDILWFFNDPAHHTALVSGRGWSEDAFLHWLSGMIRSSLLPAEAAKLE
jgi:AcrR family transcriptional regulator